MLKTRRLYIQAHVLGLKRTDWRSRTIKSIRLRLERLCVPSGVYYPCRDEVCRTPVALQNSHGTTTYCSKGCDCRRACNRPQLSCAIGSARGQHGNTAWKVKIQHIRISSASPFAAVCVSLTSSSKHVYLSMTTECPPS